MPVEGPLADGSLAPTTVYTTERMPAATADAWAATGADVRVVDAGVDGNGVDLDAVQVGLASEYHVFQALVEGGGKLHAAFVAEDRADRLVTFIAPIVLGERGRAVLALPGPGHAGRRRSRMAGRRDGRPGRRRIHHDVRLPSRARNRVAA